jgi:DNA-binding PadR family transcriptional regulator
MADIHRSRPPRLSATESLILDLLAACGERYGLEMVEASGGQLKRGTVYVTLGRMEEKGYLTSAQEAKAPGAIGLPRRMYRLTPLGRRVRQAWGELRFKLAWEGA